MWYFLTFSSNLGKGSGRVEGRPSRSHIGIEVPKMSSIISDLSSLVDHAKTEAFNLVFVPLTECNHPVRSGLLFSLSLVHDSARTEVWMGGHGRKEDCVL